MSVEPGEVLAAGPGDVQWIAYAVNGETYAAARVGGYLVGRDDRGWWRAGEQGERLAVGKPALELLKATPPPDDFPVLVQPPPVHRALTDLGNAERLVAGHGNDLRYCKALGWLAWDGCRWRPDATGEVMRRAKATVRAICDETGIVDDANAAAEIRKWARRSEGRRLLEAMVELATSEPGIPISHDDLDADPMALNVANGTVELRTGELHPLDRDDLITKLAPIAYDADAMAPRWNKFLEEIIPKPEVRAFLQRAVGYSITGNADEHVLLIPYGTGANGKSTFLEVLRAVLGDYAQQTPASTLLGRRGDGANNDVARLRGARFVSAVETDQGKRLAEALVKRLTGGDTTTARFLFHEFFEFRPAFTLWLATNHRPRVVGTDHAMWRRLLLVNFDVQIPDDEQDLGLRDRLIETEASGILGWAVTGALAWQRDGLAPPEVVRAATSRFRAEQDVMGGFIAERCVVRDDMRVSAAALYGDYSTWCAEHGQYAMSETVFSTTLEERGFEKRRSEATGARRWFGIGLHTGEGDNDEQSQHVPEKASEPISSGAQLTGTDGKTRDVAPMRDDEEARLRLLAEPPGQGPEEF